MDRILSQGVEIPRLGLGTYGLAGDAGRASVESALELGYRHIDTGDAYDNEPIIGAAINASGLARQDLFVTTKFWFDKTTRGQIRDALAASLDALKLDWVDLYMLHWPTAALDLSEGIEALKALKADGMTRAIGVCNLTLPMMRSVLDEPGCAIAAVQLEYHPFLDQSRMLALLAERRIPLLAYSPLARGACASDPVLRRIGDKHNATAAQVAIAWLLDQEGVAAIPKAESRARQAANLEALTIVLDDEDRRAIAELPKDLRQVDPPFAPEWDKP